MRLFHEVKQVLKPWVVLLARAPGIQRSALRLAYLPRFRRWCAEHPCVAIDKPQALYQAVLSTLPHDEPINYLEFGVYRGGSLRWWLDHNRHPDSLFVGFDTFTGLPEDWARDKPRGTFSTGGKLPDIEDHRCKLVAGLFQDTLLPVLGQVDWNRPTVVHLDADLYSSTLFVLLTLVPRLKPGDTLIFDEFADYLDEFHAFDNLCAAYPFRYSAIGQNEDYTRVAIQLTAG